jgi:lysophospholipase L1-like esterase
LKLTSLEFIQLRVQRPLDHGKDINMNNLDVQETAPSGTEIPLHIEWGDRIAFLGDSITQQRFFTEWAENYLALRFPDLHLKFMNCGWGGETAEGALARMDRDLFAFYPTLVVVAYGMNDAAYTDPSDEILARFSPAMQKIVHRIQKHKARVVLLTPGMVDVRMAPSYLRNVDYNRKGVRRLADWVLQFGKEKNLPVFDVHRLMNDVAEKTGRFNSPLRLFLEGIHPNEMGHLVMAFALLKALGVPERKEEVLFDAAHGKVRNSVGVQAEMVAGPSEGHFLSIQMDQLPFYVPSAARDILPFVPFQEEFNQLRLAVNGLPHDQYDLKNRRTGLRHLQPPGPAEGLEPAFLLGYGTHAVFAGLDRVHREQIEDFFRPLEDPGHVGRNRRILFWPSPSRIVRPAVYGGRKNDDGPQLQTFFPCEVKAAGRDEACAEAGAGVFGVGRTTEGIQNRCLPLFLPRKPD